MADIIDRAQGYDEFYRQQAINDHFARRSTEQVTSNECIDCGEEIDPARLRAKPDAVRCIGCQINFERLHGRKS